MEVIYYDVHLIDECIREIVLYHNNRVLAELTCYNDILTDWEEIDRFLEEECLYDVYGDDVKFVNRGCL